jgi:hypothetical protein
MVVGWQALLCDRVAAGQDHDRVSGTYTHQVSVEQTKWHRANVANYTFTGTVALRVASTDDARVVIVLGGSTVQLRTSRCISIGDSQPT